MKKFLAGWLALTFLFCGGTAMAATAVPTVAGMSAQDYDFYTGDFNGDGYTDLLFIAKDPNHLSGIILSDGTSLTIPLQTWGDAYLGIPWSSGLYNVIIADFNGDGKDDILLQRKTPGDSYLLLTENGGIGAISQTIANTTAGVVWSADQHRIVVGDFNGDGKADVFLQATSPNGLNAIVLADSQGQFSAATPAQSWTDGYLGFNWATSEALVYSGDFNGDKLADLLIQAQPMAGTGPGTSQPAEFPPNLNGVVLAQPGTQIFTADGVQAWSQLGFGADWSPLDSAVVIGDFNGDGRSDVLLQGLTAANPTYIVYSNVPGPIFSSGVVLNSSVVPSADSFRLLVGHFANAKGDGLFLQAQARSTANYFGTISGSTLTTTVQSLPSLSSIAPSTSTPLLATTPMASALIVAANAAGRTPGQFAVSATGAATYNIPIWTPPGARGITPHLSLVYVSGSPDGPLGPGWTLGGLSAITRCNKTYAENGTPAAVTLTIADDFCMDGNRLRLTAGTYGASGSTYQTELANFANVTANGTAGNGPSYFIVQGKDGLYYEYGNTADSKAYASGGSTPYAWLLNKIRDRQGNNWTVTYSTTSGSVQPASIQYTQTPATGTSYPNSIAFGYQARTTQLSKFIAGGQILQTQELSSVTVSSEGSPVRQYNLAYATAPTTQRDRLTTVQECAGTSCLQPTTIAYQDGTPGVAPPTTASGSGATNGTVYSVDVDGDGKQDLVFAVTSGSNYLWYVQFATATGYSAPIYTGAVTVGTKDFLLDDFDGKGGNEILAPVGGIWYVYKWNGSGFSESSTGINVSTTAVGYSSADVDGDGRPDLVYLTGVGAGVWSLSVQFNTTTGTNVSFAPNPVVTTVNYAFRIPRLIGNNQQPNSSVQHFDFDGDGRQDLMIAFNSRIKGTPNVFAVIPVLSRGAASFALGTEIDNQQTAGLFEAVNWNDDGCTDLINGNQLFISGCNGTAPVFMYLPADVSMAVDWDGDGRTDAIANVGGVWQVYRSLDTGVAAGVSTGIAASTGSWIVSDQNGDGLNDLVFANASNGYAIQYGLHNGAATPSDYVRSITDGWGVNASPTYVPLTQGNYTKYSDATFPDVDFQGPMYVVNQTTQSDGTGGTFTNSLWYYGAHVNLQGRGFGGFYATRTVDSRNALMRYIYYQRDFPYIGAVFQDDVYQPNGSTLISHTLNTWTYKPLVGSDCSVRCFPYVSSSTAYAYDISAGAPLVSTTATSNTYDSFGNKTQVSTNVSDNNPASPFYNQQWSSLVTNTITPDAGANWCLDQPTSTTTQNTVPGQASQTRRVDHQVDYANCRNTQETVQPGDPRLQVTTNYAYDSCGDLDSVSIIGLDKNGTPMPARTSTSGFGTHCEFPETETNALGQVTSNGYRYDLGVRSSTTDPNGATVSWLYDGFARRTRESRPDGTATTWTYANCTPSNCAGASDLRLLVTENLLDSTGGLVRTHEQFSDGFERLRYDEANRVLGTWTVQTTQYDNLGRKVSVDVPYSAASNGYHHFTYDLLNRPTADQLFNSSGSLDRQTTMSYAGLATSITDAKLNTTTKYTDVTGALRRIVDPSPGGATNYTFDPFGNLLFMVDAAGATSTYTYNILGFKTSSADPDSGTSTYVPDSLNELVSQTDAKGQTTSFGYDALGRMTSRLEPESSTPTQWVYGVNPALHNVGRLQSVSKPDGYAELYSYDTIGRPQTTVYTEDTTYQVDYAYNALGSLDTLTYPTSTLGDRFVAKFLYSYGYVQQVKDNAAGTVFWSLSTANDSSLPTTELLGNGVQVLSSYTPWTNDLVTRSEGSGGSTNNLQNLVYGWDANQNLQQRQDIRQGLTEQFVNDSMNRLTSSTLNGSTNLAVGYDAAGNITSKSDIGSYNYTTAQSGCTYYANAQPHAVRNAGGNVYCYDADGQMTSGAGKAISWYSYNKPNSIAYGSNSTQFNYNANHQRWKQVANFGGAIETTYYVGGILEKVVKGSVTEYRHQIPIGTGTTIYTRRSDGTNSTYYVTTDHLGSGDLVMDSSANVLARESFTPFGARRGSNWQGVPTTGDYSTFDSTTRRGFTGHEMLDGVNLIHMNGRVYDPYLGRVLSPDPVVTSLSTSQSVNPFSYVMNNPLTLTDPSGYSWFSKIFNAIGNVFDAIGHFIATYWRPILAIVVAIVSYYTLAPYLSGLLTPAAAASTGTVSVSVAVDGGLSATFAYSGITAVGAAVAGAISGALAGGILGGWHGALLGAASGAAFGAIGGAYGNSWNLARVGLTSTVGGISSDLSGQGFWRGFEVALGVSLVSWGYQAINQGKYDPRWSGGDGHEEKPDVSGVDPRSVGASGNYNHWGLAWSSLPSYGGYVSPPGPFYENGWFSKFMDSIYGQNATAALHDNMMAEIFNSSGNFLYRALFVPAMPVAAGMAYTTLVGPADAAVIENNR